MPAKTPMTWIADWLRVRDQADDPATPASGYAAFYSKGDAPYFKNDAGTETSLTPAGSDTTGWVAASSAWSYSSADAPTFVITTAGDETGSIGVGMRIKLTQTTAKYFIVTAITASTITVYGGTDYTLANAAITSPYFSGYKSPLGFPTSPAKWTVRVTDTAQRTQATPSASTWYNNGSITISIPIGVWRVNWDAIIQFADASSSAWIVFATLSTANNSQSDADLTDVYLSNPATSGIAPLHRSKYLSLASKTSYYLNEQTTSANLDNMYFRGDLGTTVIQAVCAYL